MNSDVMFHQINHWKKPASMTITDKIENGQRIFQTKLVFKTCKSDLQGARGLAFLAETIDGDKYLIGNNDRPYPVITASENHPNNYADSQLTEYVVTWNSTLKPPIIR